MTRLETFEKAPQGFGAPRSRWYTNLWNHAKREFNTMDRIVDEYGGKWAYAERTDAMRPLFPEYLDFEDDMLATAFILRWS